MQHDNEKLKSQIKVDEEVDGGIDKDTASINIKISASNEIREEMVNDATRRAKNIEQKLVDVPENPAFFIAKEDKNKWNGMVAAGTDSDDEINIILPGYATGDRYTLGMLMLLNDKIKIHIVFNEGDEVQQRNAEEAYALYQKILSGMGKKIEDYVSFNSMSKLTDQTLVSDNPSPWNKLTSNFVSDACMVWNTKPHVRDNVHNIKGAQFPSKQQETHLFHVSISTMLVAKEFEKDREKPLSLFQKVFLKDMISEARRTELDGIYAKHFSQIKDQVILWVSNRSETPDLRVAEIFSRPVMWEQISGALKENGISTIYAGDEWGKRHPYTQQEMQNKGKSDEVERPLQAFWAKFKISTREEQWYLMAKIMQNNRAIIGNRSGALEPFALLGMPVLYLEHKGIFTSERLAQLINRVATWKRVVAQESTGYGIHANPEGELKPSEARTEDRYRRDSSIFLDNHLKYLLSRSARDNPSHNEVMKHQDDIALTKDVIERGVLTKTELNEIVKIIIEYGNLNNPSIIHANSQFDAEKQESITHPTLK